MTSKVKPSEKNLENLRKAEQAWLGGGIDDDKKNVNNKKNKSKTKLQACHTTLSSLPRNGTIITNYATTTHETNWKAPSHSETGAISSIKML